MTDPNNKNSGSLFLYTALIFVAAIIIIIFAFFTQTHVERAQPSASSEAVSAAPDDGNSVPEPENSAGPQGIAKTAAQLSEDNRELLEENRALHNRLDELEERQKINESLIEAYYCVSNNNIERAKLLIEDIDYESLFDDEKTLYDFISSNIQ